MQLGTQESRRAPRKAVSAPGAADVGQHAQLKLYRLYPTVTGTGTLFCRAATRLVRCPSVSAVWQSLTELSAHAKLYFPIPCYTAKVSRRRITGSICNSEQKRRLRGLSIQDRVGRGLAAGWIKEENKIDRKAMKHDDCRSGGAYDSNAIHVHKYYT